MFGVSALVVTSLTAEKINLFNGSVQDTSFTIMSLNTQFSGKNRITISVTLQNTDSSIHSGNITIQLLNSNGDVILEQYALTGNVVSSGTWSRSFTFNQNGIVAIYDNPFIAIRQLT